MPKHETENIKPFTLYVPESGYKKFIVYVPNYKTGCLKKVAFGDNRYEDYTIHKDKDRRTRYWMRHINDRIDDPYSPGFWSMYALWGISSNLNTAFKDSVKRAKKLLK